MVSLNEIVVTAPHCFIQPLPFWFFFLKIRKNKCSEFERNLLDLYYSSSLHSVAPRFSQLANARKDI
jgi:hypothetical protein